MHPCSSQDRCGYTPLHRAALWGNLSAVMALVVAGADPRMETDKGETPEFLADEFPAIRCFLKVNTDTQPCLPCAWHSCVA